MCPRLGSDKKKPFPCDLWYEACQLKTCDQRTCKAAAIRFTLRRQWGVCDGAPVKICRGGFQLTWCLSFLFWEGAIFRLAGLAVWLFFWVNVSASAMVFCESLYFPLLVRFTLASKWFFRRWCPWFLYVFFFLDGQCSYIYHYSSSALDNMAVLLPQLNLTLQ